MCGRYSLFDEQNNTEINQIIENINHNYPNAQIKTGEIYPTNLAPILVQQQENIVPLPVIWGFPKFQGKGVIINARSETAAQKKTFRDSLLQRRCLVPSTGFYEWSQDTHKQKYLFTLPGENVLYLAGIYNQYQDEQRFVILTTSANASMADIHNRMPVILPKSKTQEWLKNTDAALHYLSSSMPALQHMEA